MNDPHNPLVGLNLTLQNPTPFLNELKARGEPEWLLEWRRQCLQAAAGAHWPESRYTRLRRFSPDTIHIVIPPDTSAPKQQPPRGPAITIEVVDGIVRNISVPKPLADFVFAASFRDLVTQNDARLAARYQGRELHIDPKEGRPLAMLHGGWVDGLWLEVKRHPARLHPTIQITRTRTRAATAVVFPMNISAGPGTQSNIYLETRTDDLGAGADISSLEVEVGDGAHANVYSIMDDNESMTAFIYHYAHVGRDANLGVYSGWFGAQTAIIRSFNQLEAPGATLKDIQVLFCHNRQHFDFQSFTHHQAHDTRSEVLLRGALKDAARNVFYGLVQIDQGARNAVAELQDHILLLDSRAHADAIPALEIKENDVSCRHSASVGQIDKDQLYYIMSRGIDESEARKLIIAGFLSPAYSQVPDGDFAQRFIQIVDSRGEYHHRR